MWSFDVFFDHGLNKWLSKQSEAGLRCHCAHYEITVMYIITVMSHMDHGRSNHWPLYCLSNHMFSLHNMSKLYITCPLWWESTGDNWIPLTKGQSPYLDGVFILKQALGNSWFSEMIVSLLNVTQIYLTVRCKCRHVIKSYKLRFSLSIPHTVAMTTKI